jgi:hypothetical protein
LVQSCFFLNEEIGIANQDLPGLQSTFYMEKKMGEELGEYKILFQKVCKPKKSSAIKNPMELLQSGFAFK